MARTRPTYTPEFKAEAVKLVTEQGYSVAETAPSLGLCENLIRNWKQTIQDKGQQAFPGHGKLSPFEDENRCLRAENKRLLAERDILVNTVAKLMREAGIAAKTTRQFRGATTDSNHDLPVADNLLDRQFDVSTVNAVWLADITYVPTREGWLDLAAVEDLYWRRVVGWAMAASMESRLVVDALALAVQRRLPKEGLLTHSDGGSQYASDHYQRLLAKHGIPCSMSRRGDCWDNGPRESFFASLKQELIHDADFANRAEARAEIVEYSEIFYNNQRRHSSLGSVAPAEYEQPEHS